MAHEMAIRYSCPSFFFLFSLSLSLDLFLSFSSLERPYSLPFSFCLLLLNVHCFLETIYISPLLEGIQQLEITWLAVHLTLAPRAFPHFLPFCVFFVCSFLAFHLIWELSKAHREEVSVPGKWCQLCFHFPCPLSSFNQFDSRQTGRAPSRLLEGN